MMTRDEIIKAFLRTQLDLEDVSFDDVLDMLGVSYYEVVDALLDDYITEGDLTPYISVDAQMDSFSFSSLEEDE